MDITHAIILGFIQGFTEFLPVSSSGHLVIFQKLLPGFSQPGILFDVVIHMGTLVAVFYFFRKKILSITIREIVLLGIATIPAVIAGITLQDFFEESFDASQIAIGIQFIVTAFICFFTDKFNGDKKEITSQNAILIGVAQAISILPAISRSGSTIFMSRVLGIDKSRAAEFSFLLSIPAILGATVLQFKSHAGVINQTDVPAYIAGFIVAAVVGYFSISFTLKTLLSSKFKWFGVYTLVLGLILIVTR